MTRRVGKTILAIEPKTGIDYPFSYPKCTDIPADKSGQPTYTLSRLVP